MADRAREAAEQAGRQAGAAGTGEPVAPDFAAQGRQRADPILQALTAREQYLKPFAARKELGAFAERGFGLSGIAEQGIQRALGDVTFDFEQQRQRALTDETRRAMDEYNQSIQNDFQRQQLELQRTANQNAEDAARPWWRRL